MWAAQTSGGRVKSGLSRSRGRRRDRGGRRSSRVRGRRRSGGSIGSSSRSRSRSRSGILSLSRGHSGGSSRSTRLRGGGGGGGSTGLASRPCLRLIILHRARGNGLLPGLHMGVHRVRQLLWLLREQGLQLALQVVESVGCCAETWRLAPSSTNFNGLARRSKSPTRDWTGKECDDVLGAGRDSGVRGDVLAMTSRRCARGRLTNTRHLCGGGLSPNSNVQCLSFVFRH